MSEEDRARQAQVHELIASGVSVAGLPPPPLLRMTHSKSSSKSSSPKSRSPSSSRNRQQGGGGNGDGTIDKDAVGLTFQKQEIVASPADRPSSHLALQLQLARSALDESSFPRSSSNMSTMLASPHRFTVYLPHEEGSMVQIQVAPTCSAHQLVKAALDCAREENGGDLPVGLLDDPFMYRAYVAEEDTGEVDTDFPVCDIRMNVCDLGVEAFVLRDRVDAAAPAPPPIPPRPSTQTRPAANSLVEGPGGDHSRSGKAGSGFATLETETDDTTKSRGGANKPNANNPACCGGKCVVQ